MFKLKKPSKRLTIVLIILLVFIFMLVVGGIRNANAARKAQEAAEQAAAESERQAQLAASTESDLDIPDTLLRDMQPDLIETYGQLPDGYIWDMNGDLLSLGDKNLSAEEVVYNYLNGLRTLDMSMAQKYSRDSIVVETYEGYFDSTNRVTDYTDQFMRNMYRQALLSMQIKEIVNSSIFAENKQVFTVRVEMLDLTLKTFWEKDKAEIYTNLNIYSSDESDSTRADIYLYDYILDYYSSPEAATREVQFDLTLEKYPDLDTGWLVSIDTDVDSACRYADGTLVVSYINEMYLDEGLEWIEAQKNAVDVSRNSEGDEASDGSESVAETTEETGVVE